MTTSTNGLRWSTNAWQRTTLTIPIWKVTSTTETGLKGRPMKSLADGLPVEIARQVHADWRKNEAAYWTVREQLLGQYQGQWIGFADNAVVASGRRPVMVLQAGRQAADHPYFICVGRE